MIIAENVDDPEVVTKAIARLVRASAIEHTMSKQHEDELYDSIVKVIEGFGEALQPTEST